MGERSRSSRLLGWWYVCIGLGFIALGVRSLLLGASPWMTALRWGIAAGFLLLGGLTLRGAGGIIKQ